MRRIKLIVWFAMAAAPVLFFALAGCAGPQVYTGSIPNLLQVRDDVFRSGQPSTREDWQMLRAMGVRHVIKLNFPIEGSDDGAAAAGIEVHPVGIQPSTKGIDVFGKPTPEAMAKLRELADRILYAKGGEGVWLVHCQNGHDRTGLVVGLIRMVVDGWTPERAWDEMLARGYHPQLVGLDRAFHEFAEGMD